jgi:hypothetical protein
MNTGHWICSCKSPPCGACSLVNNGIYTSFIFPIDFWGSIRKFKGGQTFRGFYW